MTLCHVHLRPHSPQALSESIKPDAALSERRLHIQRSTEYIAEVGAAVKENAAAVEKEIYRRLQVLPSPVVYCFGRSRFEQEFCNIVL